MKRVGLGTRPSEVKARDKTIDIGDETLIDRDLGRHQPGSPRRSSGAAGKVAAVIVIIALSVVVGVGVSMLLPFELALDHALVTTGDREMHVQNGANVTVAYADGFMVKRVALKGFYRLFPPDDVTLEVEGVPETAGRFNEDLVPLLKPEEQTVCNVVIRRGEVSFASFTCTIIMQARDWILRAESVTDEQTKTTLFKKAIEADPDAPEARIALGRMYEGRKEYEAASREYEAALRSDPGNVSLLTSLLELYARVGNSQKQIATCERLAEADKKNAEKYLYDAGLLAEKGGDMAMTLKLFRKVLAKNRGHINARTHLIKIYVREKQWQRAAANTRVLLEYQPDNADLHLFLADAYLSQNKITAAIESTRAAEKLQPNDADIFIQLANLYQKAGNTDQAIAYYKKVVRVTKANHIAYNNLGILLEKAGKLKDAIKNYETAVRIIPAKITYRLNLADAYEKDKQWDKAIATYERIVKLDRKNKEAYEALAILYLKKKNKKKALESYRALAALDPTKVLWHRKLADLYESMGSLESAQKEYKTILSIDPKNSTARQKRVELALELVRQKNRQKLK